MTKITIDRATVEQALEALEFSNEYLEAISDKLFPNSKKANPGSTLWHVQKAITALRQALEQPNEFTPDWDQIKPFHDRIAELESVARQALEAMQENWRTDKSDAAITALRQALQQPNEFHPDWDQLKPSHDRIAELESVAKQALAVIDSMEQNYGSLWQVSYEPEQLDEIAAALRRSLQNNPSSGESHEDSWKSCEEWQKQEPVAIRWKRPNYGWVYEDYKPSLFYGKGVKAEHLYTTPQVIDKSAAIRIATALGWTPPRKPLTDEEIEDLYFDNFSIGELKAFARAIEAAHGITKDKK